MHVGLIAKTCLLLGAAFWCVTANAQTDAWFARHIWTGEGEPVVDGVLVTVDGKISAVGPRDSIQIPAEARRHELGNQVIIPGIVAGQTSLTGDNDVEKTLTPEIQAIDGFDFHADRQSILAAGVTTAQISPGDNRLMPGMGAVVKLAGKDAETRILKRQESLRIVLNKNSRNPPTIYEPPVGPVSIDRPLEPTQPQLSKTLPGAIAGLRIIFKNATAERRYVTAEPAHVVDAVAAHVNRSGVVRFSASTPAEIRGALELANRYSLHILLTDCSGLKSIRDFSNWRRVRGVVLQGLTPGSISNPDVESLTDIEAPWDFVRPLIDAGLPVAIRPRDDADLSKLMFVAGQFLQGDVTRPEVLGMLTRWPAEMMGVDDRVGTLSSGKDADFVILTDDPFTMRTAVTATYIGGSKVFSSQPENATTVIHASRIYTGTGNVLNNATLVVKGNSVRGIGSDVSAPLNSEVRDFADAVIVPGYVDLGTSLGIGGTLNGNVSLQTKLGNALYADDPALELARKNGITTALLGSLNNDGPTPMVAYKLGDDTRVIADPVAIRFRIGDNPAESVASITRALDKGKTYVDSWNKYETELAAYEAAKATADKKPKKDDKESGDKKADESKDSDDKKDTKDEKSDKQDADEKKEAEDKKEESKKPDSEGRRGREGSRRRGVRPGSGTEPRRPRTGSDDEKGKNSNDQKSSTDKKQDDEKDEKDDGGKDGESKEDADAPEKPELKEDLEPYRALFAGQIPVFVEARRGDAIKAALTVFCEKYKLRTVLVGADDVARLPHLLKGHAVSVCAGPEMMVEIDRKKINLPQMLANEQVPFGFQSKGTTGVSQLPHAIQFSVAEGLGASDGLQALTHGPATMLSNGMSFGSLNIGKDADLVVLSGPPFEHSSKVLAVMIDGQWVYEREDN